MYKGEQMEEQHLAIAADNYNFKVHFLERLLVKFGIVVKEAIIRLFEIIVSFIGVILLIPFTLLIILRKFSTRDNSKIFRVTDRIGKNGKIFKMIEYNSNDSKFLKKSGLYNYPEIINIFLGQMSFVGPKAYKPEDIKEMGEYYSYIIQHKPGVTGLNQIALAQSDTLEEKLDADLRYHYKKTVIYDLKVIAITLLVTLRRKNAYDLAHQLRNSIHDIGVLFSAIIKRLLDILGGLVGILILIPVTAIIKIASLASGDKDSIFFVQDRIGKNGKLFKLFKFRSMVNGADDILKEILAKDPESADYYRINKKLKNDPRLTRIGKIIRKTSIDELPQLINVFIGNMSLVGPRPYLPREKEDMKEFYDIIVQVKPGITGYWQVRGRSDTSFEQRLRYDRQYSRDVSFFTDLKILFKTVAVVFKGEGAE